MKQLNILFTNKRPQVEIDYLEKHLGDFYTFILPEDYTEDEILEHIEKADVLFGDYVTKKMIENGNIKLIQVPTAGINNLDIDLLSKYSVTVCNSHSNALSVAETALSLLLSIAKKIPYHDKLLRSGDWNNKNREDSKTTLSPYGSYLTNKTVGFIGYGNIAKAVSKLLSGFNCKQMAIVRDKHKHYEALSFLGDYDDLEYVLQEVDYLIVAAPLTKETKGMLDKDNLSKLKKSSYIINISRGEIIDEESLYYILNNNLIRGAAIDVWYNYPENDELTYPSVNYDFHELNNIIMSPHRADLIYDEYPLLDDGIENLKALREGRKLINILNFDKDY